MTSTLKDLDPLGGRGGGGGRFHDLREKKSCRVLLSYYIVMIGNGGPDRKGAVCALASGRARSPTSQKRREIEGKIGFGGPGNQHEM